MVAERIASGGMEGMLALVCDSQLLDKLYDGFPEAAMIPMDELIAVACQPSTADAISKELNDTFIQPFMDVS